jgi:hypothetical protein
MLSRCRLCAGGLQRCSGGVQLFKGRIPRRSAWDPCPCDSNLSLVPSGGNPFEGVYLTGNQDVTQVTK